MCAIQRKRVPRDPDADIRHSPWYATLNTYLEWMAYSGYTAGTLRTARHDLRMFVRWCDSRSLNAPSQLSRPVLEQYQRHLYLLRKADGKPLAVSAQLHRLQHMKSLCRWLVRQNLLPSNPAADLVLPRPMRRLPRSILSIEEVTSILEQPDTGTPVGLRDRAILEVLYSTGLRRLEIVNLNIDDLDIRRCLLLVRQGKGGRDRYVPVGERAMHWIGRWLDEAREELALPGVLHLFVSEYGGLLHDGMMSNWVKRYMERAGIRKTGSCHLFRHACATHMLEGGADVRFIQAMLGHANLSTTQIYTHVSIDKLQQIHAATHPARLISDSGEKNGNAGQSISDAAQLILDAIGVEEESHSDATSDKPE